MRAAGHVYMQLLTGVCAYSSVQDECALQHGDFAGRQAEFFIPQGYHVFHLHGDDSTQFQALRTATQPT